MAIYGINYINESYYNCESHIHITDNINESAINNIKNTIIKLFQTVIGFISKIIGKIKEKIRKINQKSIIQKLDDNIYGEIKITKIDNSLLNKCEDIFGKAMHLVLSDGYIYDSMDNSSDPHYVGTELPNLYDQIKEIDNNISKYINSETKQISNKNDIQKILDETSKSNNKIINNLNELVNTIKAKSKVIEQDFHSTDTIYRLGAESIMKFDKSVLLPFKNISNVLTNIITNISIYMTFNDDLEEQIEKMNNNK